jgi:hypothetical protein
MAMPIVLQKNPAGFVLFAVFVVLYALTAQRGVSWQDSGGFQQYVLSGTFTDLGGGGLAVVHPWYLKTARLFCLCFPEKGWIFAVNLFSGVGMATAVTLLYALVRRLTGQTLPSVAAAATLGLAQMAWWLATIAEVYTWSVAFLIAELLCVQRICDEVSGRDRRVAWCVLLALNGMHASLHNVALLNLPVYAGLWLIQLRTLTPTLWRSTIFAGVCVVCWLVGATLLVTMVVSDMGQTHSLVTTIKRLLVGTGYGSVVLGIGGVQAKLALGNLALASVSVASPCWFFSFRAGIGRFTMPCFRRVLLALTVIHALFWVRYFVPDQATFVLPTLGLGAVWLGLGAARFGKGTVLTLLTLGVVCQVVFPFWLAGVVENRATRVRALPFRDEARYWLVPWKHNERSAEQFVEAVDKQLKKGDVLVSDLTAVNPIVAARTAKIVSSDWQLISAWSGETGQEALEIVEKTLSSGGRAFVVSAVPGYMPSEFLSGRFNFEQDGVLWRVKRAGSLKDAKK